jgi:uncharacterized protein (DUF58 family)
MIGSLWWLIVGALLLAAIGLRQGPLFLFSLLLLLGSAASALWARYCLAGVQYRRVLGANRLNFGEETELAVEIINAKPMPLGWLRIRDEWPIEVTLLTGTLEGSYKPERLLLANWLAMRWYERVRRVYRLRALRRGAYDFGPAELTSGDLFGFRRRTRSDPGTDALLVYPKLVPLGEWRLPSGRPLGEALAPRRLIDDPLRFAGARDYIPGDNPRHIHWKNSARWGRLQTRVFEPEATQALVLVPDVQTTERGMYWVQPAYLELIISAAASIASHALDERHAVGLYTNSSALRQSGVIEVPLSRAPGQRAALLEACARMRGFPLLRAEELLYRLLHSLPWGATVVVLSAHPTAALQAALLAIQDAGHAAALLTVGEAPIDPPAGLEVHYLGGLDAWKNLAELELG